MVAALVLAGLLAAGPGAAPGSASPGQERGNGVATLVLRDAVLVGISIRGGDDPNSGPDGGPVPVVRLRVSRLSDGTSLHLVRPTSDGSLRVATRSRSRGGDVTGRDVVLDATWACVRGLGITRAGLFRGWFDDPLNDALDVDPQEGFDPNWVTDLANGIGALRVPVVVRELRAEVAALDAERFSLPGATVVRSDRRVQPLGECGADDEDGLAGENGAADENGDAAELERLTPGRALTRLREVDGLERLRLRSRG